MEGLEQEIDPREEMRRKRTAIFLLFIFLSMFILMAYQNNPNQNNNTLKGDETQLELLDKEYSEYQEKHYSVLLDNLAAEYNRVKEQQSGNQTVLEDPKNEEDQQQSVSKNQPSDVQISLVHKIVYSLRKTLLQDFWSADSYSLKNQQNFGYFAKNEGQFRAITEKMYPIESAQLMTKLRFNLYEGKYSDSHQASGEILLNVSRILEITSDTVMFLPLESTIQISNQFKLVDVKSCEVSLKLRFETQSAQNGTMTIEIPQVYIEATSADCNFQFTSITHANSQQVQMTKALQYSIFITMIALVQFFSILKMFKRMFEDENENQKISLIALCWVFCWDGFFALLHFMGVFDLFQYYATPSFLYFVLWIIFERNLILYIWRCRNSDQQNYDQLRKDLQKFNCYLYIGVVLSFYLSVKYILQDWLFILSNLYLVPQIIQNAKKGQNINRMDWDYILGLMASRTLVSLYVRGCPYNSFQLEPHPWSCVIILLLVGGQIAVLRSQIYFGPRFFIPKRFKPKQHEYFQHIDENYDLESQLDQNNNNDCVICMTNLSLSPAIHMEIERNESPFIQRLKQKKNSIMQTPCKHKFHVPCLLNWMSIKMDCPTCRARLPPVE